MSRLPILVAGLVSFEVAPIIHPVMEHANNKDARLLGFEEDAVTATGGHLQARPQVIAASTDDVPATRPFMVSRNAAMY